MGRVGRAPRDPESALATEEIHDHQSANLSRVRYPGHCLRLISTPRSTKPLGSGARYTGDSRAHNRVVVGRDGRLTSEAHADAFIRGVTACGIDAFHIGEVPTPLVYFGLFTLDRRRRRHDHRQP